MNMWNDAFDDVNAIDLRSDELSTDQRLKVAGIKALLSISQELSQIHHAGINPKFSKE